MFISLVDTIERESVVHQLDEYYETEQLLKKHCLTRCSVVLDA